MPRYLGLELYGLGLLIVVPVLLIGGFWEPVVQSYSNDRGGIPKEWWPYGIILVLTSYGIYLYAMLPIVGGGGVTVLLGLVFALQYIFVVYVTAIYQAKRKYGELLCVSVLGLLICSVVFLIEKAAWLVCLFYCLYFFPLLVAGIFYIRKRGIGAPEARGGVIEILNAISTRIFFIMINNFYVLIVGFFYGPSKAALLKIVISLSSAFRFVSPLNIGHFYSVMAGIGWRKRFALSFIPLLCFVIAVLIAVVSMPALESYLKILLANNYIDVVESFLSLSWGVPFYLWSPYLTIVFFKSLGWQVVSLACLMAVSVGAVCMWSYDASAFFVVSSLTYCGFVLLAGIFMETRMLRAT